MKFTKILSLVLVLILALSAFAACGGGDETKAPSKTDAPGDDTTVAPNETDEPCDHPEKFMQDQPAMSVEPTCIGGLQDGKTVKRCLKCGEYFETSVPATHTYRELSSVDGAYTKFACFVCGDDVYVEDADGNKVEDYSNIEFPFFAADFEEIDLLEKIAYLYEGVSIEEAFAQIIVDAVENNSFLNVPTGTSANNPNGYISVVDDNNVLVSNKYSVTFKSKFDEKVSEGELALVTWNVGDESIALVKTDAAGKIYVAGGAEAGAFLGKGWDTVTVEVDPAAGTVKVTVDAISKDGTTTTTATGSLGVSVAGKTGSAIQFFDDASQFEAYIDEIEISVE